MLKLKCQYFGHVMQRSDSFEKTLMLEKTEGGTKRGREGEMIGWHHRLNAHEFGQTLGDGERQRSLASCSSWGHQESNAT